jgi:hypothetical protein
MDIRPSIEDLLRRVEELTHARARHDAQLAAYKTLPLGTILPFYGDPVALAGTGWVLCDAANSATYGVDGQGRPRVPDLEARFLMGGVEGAKGQRGGRSHLKPAGPHQHGGFTGDANIYVPGGGPSYWFDQNGGTMKAHNHGIGPDGTHDHGAGGEIRPPYTTVMFIIRLDL